VNRLLIEDPDELLPTCSACKYPVPKRFLTQYGEEDDGDGKMLPIRLCALCANNLPSGAASWRHRPDIETVMKKHDNFNTNAILDQIGAFKGMIVSFEMSNDEELDEEGW